MDKTEILNRLDKLKFYKDHVEKFHANGNGQGKGCCPFHPDEHPSLSTNHETGQYFCHVCNDGGDVIKFYMKLKQVSFKEALNQLSEYSGQSREKVTNKTECVYPYRNEGGNLLFEVVRYTPKTFRQRRPDGKGGYIYNMEGVRLIPYNLQNVIASDTVYICEGENDCHNLARLGLITTTNPQGAGKWRDEFGQYFTGKDVVILCDNDEPGKKHGQDVAKKLTNEHTKSIKLIEQLPGVPQKGDVSDWLRLPGNDKSKLIELVKDAPLWTPKECNETAGFDITKALKIGAELQALDIPINWAVKGLVPQQAITLLSAKGGMGKTILSISMSDVVSKGIPFLGLETNMMPVVYIDFENSLPTLVERVKRIDASDVLFWHPTNEIKPPRLDSKEYEFYKKLPRGALLIFDTLRASQSRDENDSQHMAMIMQRLKELRDCGYTILILHHTSKSSDRIYKGSTAIFDLCDHNLSLHKVKRGGYTPEENEGDDDTDDYCYRLGTQDKTRYEPFHIFLEFDIEKGCFVQALDPDTETLEEIYNLIKDKEPLKTNEAYELIKNELGIKKKGKVLGLLKKGIGKYFKREQPEGGRALYYSIIVKSQSPAIYTGTMGLSQKTQSPSIGTITQQKHLETLVNTAKSQSPDHAGTMGTLPKTIVPDDSEKTNTEGTIVSNFSNKEIPEEIPEVDYVEVVSNV